MFAFSLRLHTWVLAFYLGVGGVEELLEGGVIGLTKSVHKHYLSQIFLLHF